MSKSRDIGPVKYPECSKGGYHIGQVLNLVCLQPKCHQNNIICGICYEEDHKNHKIKPLKLIINNSKNYLQHLTPMNIDSGKINKMVEQNRINIVEKFDVFQKKTNQTLSNIKSNISIVCQKILEQIQLNSGSNDELIQNLKQIQFKGIQTGQQEKFNILMKKLLLIMPVDDEKKEKKSKQKKKEQMSSQQIEKQLFKIQQRIQKDLDKKSGQVKKDLEVYMKVLQTIVESSKLFESKQQFRFSKELKHIGLNLVSDTVIKSSAANNYHMGLIQPSLQENGGKKCTLAFKVNSNTSNWLGMGVCYKKMAQQKNFTFNLSLGHGGYMISSNSGSWSSTDSSKNSVVTSFPFVQGDIILVTYDPDESIIFFKKNGTEQNYTLQFTPVEGDQLCFCTLFYYGNDEIQILDAAEYEA